VAASVAAFPAIEVVDSRYRDFNARNPLERLADHGLNGAFVAGAEAGDWRGLDLSRLQVTLSIGGRTIVERTGGHPTGDPLGTAHAFVNAMRARGGVHKGELVTTGSCSGMNFAEPGARVVARFEGLGAAEVTFVDG
jgi:2-keto-4-pentenoate hydratase